MTFTLQNAEEMYQKAMDDADEGDYSAQLFVKHCDPFDFVDNNDGKTDDAFRDAFHNDPDKNKFMFLTTVYPRVHPTEEIAAALVLKWTKQYSDDSEMRPVITKANECLNKKDYIGALDVIHNALPVDADALRDGGKSKVYDYDGDNAEAPCSLLASWQRGQEGAGLNINELPQTGAKALKEALDHDIDYAEMHREEKALKKVKRRGRKKQREKNRRLRENRDKESREKKRLLRKKVAEKNEKKKQSKRERKRFSPMSKDMRMLHDSIKDGFALK